MELLIVITNFFISFLILLTPSSSLQFHMHSSEHKQGTDIQHSFHYTLPRKLRFTEGVTTKSFEGQESLAHSHQKQKKYVPGKSYKKEQATMKRMGESGTWKEWMEGTESSHEFFTMDYSHVRRRRPIHNK